MGQAGNPRKFLVVVDKTPECSVAVRFATRRAQHTGGRVTMLCVAQLADFQQWRGVEEIMRDEAHQEAENLLHNAAKDVNELSGIISELVIVEGSTKEARSTRRRSRLKTKPDEKKPLSTGCLGVSCSRNLCAGRQLFQDGVFEGLCRT